MMEPSQKILNMVMEFNISLMVINTVVSISLASFTGKENICGKMVLIMMVILLMGIDKVKASGNLVKKVEIFT